MARLFCLAGGDDIFFIVEVGELSKFGEDDIANQNAKDGEIHALTNWDEAKGGAKVRFDDGDTSEDGESRTEQDEGVGEILECELTRAEQGNDDDLG